MDRNPTPPPELSAEVDGAKGDTIGDTLISERWVLKILLKLNEMVGEAANGSEVLDPGFETELCELWDMTFEFSVAQWLVNLEVPDLLLVCARKCPSVRLKEISIGIFGNLLTHKSIGHDLVKSEESSKIISSLLLLTDSLTLIQTIRVLVSVLWACQGDQQLHDIWLKNLTDDDSLDQVVFILNNSKNVDLLNKCFEFLRALVSVSLENDVALFRICTQDLLNGILQAVQELNIVSMDRMKHYWKEMLNIIYVIHTFLIECPKAFHLENDFVYTLCKYYVLSYFQETRDLSECEVSEVDSLNYAMQIIVSLLSIIQFDPQFLEELCFVTLVGHPNPVDEIETLRNVILNYIIQTICKTIDDSSVHFSCMMNIFLKSPEANIACVVQHIKQHHMEVLISLRVQPFI